MWLTVDPEWGRKRRCVEGELSDGNGSDGSSSSDGGGDDDDDDDDADYCDSDTGTQARDGESHSDGEDHAAARTDTRLPVRPFGLDEAPLLLKVLGQTAAPFGMEQLTLSSLGFPEPRRESPPPPPQPPQEPRPLPELDIALPGSSGGAQPFVPTAVLLERLDAGLQAVRAELDRQRRAAPLRDSRVTPFHSSVLARAAATGGLVFTPYVYREPHDLLAPPPPPQPQPQPLPLVPVPPAAGVPLPPVPQQQQLQPPPPPPVEPPRGWLPIKPSHITAEHFTTGIPLPRPVTSTKLVDCKDFILSSCHNVCTALLSLHISALSHPLSRGVQQPTCAYRHCNSARQQWHLKRGGGACFDWLRGLCTNENCRFVHFPPAAVLAIVPTHL